MLTVTHADFTATGPVWGQGRLSHSASVSFPVGVSTGTAVFSVLALCLYLGQAYFLKILFIYF